MATTAARSAATHLRWVPRHAVGILLLEQTLGAEVAQDEALDVRAMTEPGLPPHSE